MFAAIEKEKKYYYESERKKMQAVDAYVSTKNLDTDNGNTRIFKTDISYTNHKTGMVTPLVNTQIIVSYVVAFSCYTVCISGLQDIAGCFVEHSTNFNVFTYSNGQLTIKGIDKTGTKGDFTLVLV